MRIFYFFLYFVLGLAAFSKGEAQDPGITLLMLELRCSQNPKPCEDIAARANTPPPRGAIHPYFSASPEHGADRSCRERLTAFIEMSEICQLS
jgi:hypothetical protein